MLIYNQSNVKKLFTTIILATVALFTATPIFAVSDNAVQIANYFLLSGTTLDDPENVEALAKYDLLVLPAEAQSWNPNFSNEIRELNPDITLLAYVASVSWNTVYWNDPVHDKLYEGIESSFWLRDKSGNQMSVWPGTKALDLTSGWNEYLANFVAEEILNDDYWDGVFYDEAGDAISWVGDVKLSNGASDIDRAWINAYTELFKNTRELVGNDKIIISNGSSELQHAPYVNGRLFESFPTPWEGDGSWKTVMDRAWKFKNKLVHSPLIFFDVDTTNTGNSEDYGHMRYGLASALMADAYFGFSFGTESHAQLWWYDEYSAYLGKATDEAKEINNSMWTREFSNGKVIVNPTNDEHTTRLPGEYEKIHGSQDSEVNDGSIVYSVTLDPWDGILLLRPIEEILEGVFLNGAFARVFDGSGETYRTGFFSYDSDYIGGTQIIKFDIDNDNNLETVVADVNQVFIYNEDGTLYTSFYPYTENFRGGVNISVGDLESDGWVEIVTGAEVGGGAHIRVFNSDGILINPGFFAYDEVYRGGVNVTIGDLNGDGWYEIIAGAGVGGGPHVRVFNKDGKVINPGFFAYDEYFRGGVNVSAADVNGDGMDEIITGPGSGGSPLVRVFNKDGKMLSEFYSGDRSVTNGVEISSADLDGDNIFEIIAFTREVFTLSGSR